MTTDGNKAVRVRILIEGELTEKILGAAFKVHSTLGMGFLERVYENALVVELSRMQLPIEQQRAMKVTYEGVIVGDFFADLIVDGRVLLECKAISNLESAHEAQLMNYMRITKTQVGYLLNFGHKDKLEWKRIIITEDRIEEKRTPNLY